MSTETVGSSLTKRWPTALGLVVAAATIAAIVGVGLDEDLIPGVATMMAIYVVAYAVGKPGSAWFAFLGLAAAAALMGVFEVEAAVWMTVVLGMTWIWAVARRRPGDPWFTVETVGVVLFGGLTIAAFLADSTLAGVLAGVGWFSHGLWDAYHFTKGQVVSRAWSELCAVVDIPVGTTLIVVSLMR